MDFILNSFFNQKKKGFTSPGIPDGLDIGLKQLSMVKYFPKNQFSLPWSESYLLVRNFSSSFPLKSKKVPEEAIPKNLLQEYDITHLQPKGKVYDKKPFKMTLEANKKYAWCCCGESKTQPLCDGTHKIHTLRIKIKPIIFMVDETKEYWLCNCKQSEHRPFCDGTHKNEAVQSKTPIAKF